MYKKTKILIIEDSEESRILLAHYLIKLGYKNILIAESSETAIEQADKADLILMDIRLGSMLDGIETAKIIKNLKDIPLIYITALMDNETIERAKKTSPAGFLLKPYNIDELNSMIEIALYNFDIGKKLRENRAWLFGIIDNLSECVIVTNNKYQIEFINNNACKLLNCNKEKAIKQDLGNYLKIAEKDKNLSDIKEKLKTVPDVMLNILINKNLASIKLALTELDNNNNNNNNNNLNINYVFSFHDVTQRLKNEKEIIDSKKALQELTKHLQVKIEETRKSIARDIHDELAQSLTGLLLDLHYLKIKNKDIVIKNKIIEMIENANNTISNVKRIYLNLTPNILEDLGLKPAMVTLVWQFNKITGMKIDPDINIDNKLYNKELATNIYRIMQEALTNISKHSNATNVIIKARNESGYFYLNIKDNGKGITEKDKLKSESFGLIGIKERINSLSGEFLIEGAPRQGGGGG